MHKQLSGKFEGWYVDEENGLLFDDGNNHYYIGEIRAIFYYRGLVKGFEGYPCQILSLKNELETKIKRIKRPTITIDWGDTKEQITHPDNRR